MVDSYLFKIVTPSGTLYQDSGIFNLIAQGEEGELAILPGHTTFLTPLKISELVVWRRGRRDRKEKTMFSVSGGLLQVSKKEVAIFTPAAETPSGITIERAEKARERARKRLEERPEGVDLERAQRALVRAEIRLKVASYRESRQDE